MYRGRRGRDFAAKMNYPEKRSGAPGGEGNRRVEGHSVRTSQEILEKNLPSDEAHNI